MDRKKEQQAREREEARRNAEPPDMPADQKREMAERSFRAWLARKEDGERRARTETLEEDEAEGEVVRGSNVFEGEFQIWLDRKNSDAARRRAEDKLRAQLIQQQVVQADDARRASEQAFRHWKDRKLKEEEDRRAEAAIRSRQIAREARRTKAHLQQLLLPEPDDAHARTMYEVHLARQRARLASHSAATLRGPRGAAHA